MDTTFPPFTKWEEEEDKSNSMIIQACKKSQELAKMSQEFSFGLLEDNKRMLQVMRNRIEQLTITVNYMKDALPIELGRNEYGDPILAVMPPDNSSILDTTVTTDQGDVAVFAKEDIKRKSMIERRKAGEDPPKRNQWDEVAKFIYYDLPFTKESAQLLDLYTKLEDQKRRLIDAGRTLEAKASKFAEEKLHKQHPELYRKLKVITEEFNSTNTLVYFSRNKDDK